MSADWHHATLALNILAEAPDGLGGMVVRMRAGPDRDAFLDYVKSLFPDMLRLSPNVDDLHLFGGVDITATLTTGHVQHSTGVLATPRVLCLTMAERCEPALAARLSQYLDTMPDALVIALDESAEPGEGIPSTLAERLAFYVEPFGHAPKDWPQIPELNDDPTPVWTATESLTAAAAQFGILSLRAPMQAMRVMHALQQMQDQDFASDSDMAIAAALVFAHRATRIPQEDDDTPPAPETQPDTAEEQPETSDSMDQSPFTGDMVVDAVKALLPPEMLAGMGRIGASKGSKGNGAGQKKRGNRRGRPLPARPGRLDGRARIDILSTLRAAAPWQPVRRKLTPDRPGLLLRPSDFRLKRYETKSDRLLIFAVDASGSAAIARLNEAKGAIELLLGQAYAARDHVALVSFRGEGAETLLHPTRSLVQTKRKLGALPGGGGTPLAAGMVEALEIGVQARSRGMTPVIILVTDGKSNIALDGAADRARAREDSVKVATQLRQQGLDVLVIDSAARPQPVLRDLAQHLDATYLPMPRADAQRLSGAVASVLEPT